MASWLNIRSPVLKLIKRCLTTTNSNYLNSQCRKLNLAEQHTKDFESAAAPISEDTGDEENGRGTAFRTKKKNGIDGWSKAAPDYEENPALSAAQLERRKRLQQRHDFECIWTRNS